MLKTPYASPPIPRRFGKTACVLYYAAASLVTTYEEKGEAMDPITVYGGCARHVVKGVLNAACNLKCPDPSFYDWVGGNTDDWFPFNPMFQAWWGFCEIAFEGRTAYRELVKDKIVAYG